MESILAMISQLENVEVDDIQTSGFPHTHKTNVPSTGVE